MLCVLFLDLLVDSVAHVVVGPYYVDHCRQDDDQAVPQVARHLDPSMQQKVYNRQVLFSNYISNINLRVKGGHVSVFFYLRVIRNWP